MSPLRSSLDDAWLAGYLIEVIDELVTALNQTNEPHFIQSSQISVEAGVSVYPLDNLAPGYGKARYLYTESEGDSNFRRSPVELVSLELLTEMYGGGDPGSNIPVVPFNQAWPARAAAVYYSRANPGPGNFIEFAPVPNDAATYRFIWEPKVVRPTSPDGQGFRLDQFDALVSAKAAMLSLPHCQWHGLDKADTVERKKELRGTLDYQLGSIAAGRGLEWQFWAFRQTTMNKTRTSVIGWGANRI